MERNLQQPVSQQDGSSPFVALEEALALNIELLKSEDMSSLQSGLVAVINKCTHLMGIIGAGEAAASSSAYIKMNAGALYCDAAMRLALLNRATPVADFWIGSMLEQAEKVFAAASTPTYSSQKALKSILESLLNAACVTGELQKPALLNLLKRCGELIDNGFLSIKAHDESSTEALVAGVFLEASAGDFKNPSDRLMFLQIVGRAYQEAAYGFRQAENLKGFNEAEAGCLRLAEWIAATETEAKELTRAQAEAITTPQPAAPAGACAKCGYILTKDSAFCAKCGTPVVTAGPPPLPLRPESKVCSSCKKQLKLSAKFCSGCGKPV